jgi:general secretion pathway protein D
MKRLALVLALLGGSAAAVIAPVAPSAWAQQTLNLRDADIRAFIQDVSRATGRTFIIDPRVRGTVNVVSDEALSRNELFEVLLSTLRANGLVAIPTSGGAYRIAPEEGAAQQPTGASGAGGAGFSTQVFRLRSIDADSAADTLKPLVGRNGVIAASARGNALIVSDYTDNLRRIRGLIAQLDQDRAETRTVTLQNSAAREMAGVVNDLLKAPGEAPGARNPCLMSSWWRAAIRWSCVATRTRSRVCCRSSPNWIGARSPATTSASSACSTLTRSSCCPCSSNSSARR